MKFYYSLSARYFTNPLQKDHALDLLNRSEIGQLNLYGYLWGHFDCLIDQMVIARDILTEQGVDVGVISIIVGHPGNSLDPENHTLDLRIPSHWRYRIDRFGKVFYHCADIEPIMINDNANALGSLRDAGFSQIFFDDDFRMGNWGPQIQGCFCDACIKEFNQKNAHNLTRESLRRVIEQHKDLPLLQEWVAFNCDKMNKLVEALTSQNVSIGIMVMHRGDERHGIDISAWKKINPNLHFRVGESHFNDREFNPPLGKASEFLGIQQHITQMVPNPIYSETTIFPSKALSPLNWVFKAKMASALGISNIYLMNGFQIIGDEYWDCLNNYKNEIAEIAKIGESQTQEYPVHICSGTHGYFDSSIEIEPLPLLAGLPAKPIRADDVVDDGDILLIYGEYSLGEQWEHIISKYPVVYYDSRAMKRNRKLLHSNKPANCHLLPESLIEQLMTPQKRTRIIITHLQKKINQQRPEFPFLIACQNIGLIWFKALEQVLLINFETKQNEGQLCYHEKTYPFTLSPLEFRFWPFS